MKKLLPLLALLLSCTLAWAVEPAAPAAGPTPPPAAQATPKRPKPVRTPRFVKPPSPVIRVTTAVVNRVRLWQVTVMEGSLELRNYTRLSPGESLTLSERDIVWKIGQIVEIASDDVWAGGKSWKAGTRLFVDEKGRFLPIAGKPGGSKPR
jgi:hypothetical protein